MENGSATSSSGFKDVTAQYNDAKAQGMQRNDIEDTNRRKEIQFKASHVLLIGFLLWILCVSFLLPPSCALISPACFML